MYSRLVVPLVCAAAIVFACGPRTRTSAPVAPKPVAAAAGAPSAAPAAALVKRRAGDTVGVAASLNVAPDAEGVRIALRVVNLEKRGLEIDFPDGRTREFVVYDAQGQEVWRWSRGRLFTQTVQNTFIAAGDTAVFAEHWKGAAPGQYTAVALLGSRNLTVEQRVAFDVRPPGVIVATASPAATR